MAEINSLINFGIINIDKPSGPTSFSITEFVRKSLGISKASHMGTLDPKVTGVLPITLGRACRLASHFITHDKTYIGILHTHSVQDLENLQKIINEKFLGKIKQTPPHKSAVKRVERTREVYHFKFLESSEDKKYFLFECKVEGGTYIRKICSDLGEMIDGANMAELRRTEAGIFGEDFGNNNNNNNMKDEVLSLINKRSEASPNQGRAGGKLKTEKKSFNSFNSNFHKLHNLFDFEKAIAEYKNGDDKKLKEMIVPAEEAIKKVLPIVEVKKESVKRLLIGNPIRKLDTLGEIPKIEDSFTVFCNDKFIGTYKKTDEEDIVGRAEFVKN